MSDAEGKPPAADVHADDRAQAARAQAEFHAKLARATTRRRQQRVHQDATPCNNKKISPGELLATLNAPKELTQRQLAAVQFVLQGLSDAQIAAQLGVDRSTVY